MWLHILPTSKTDLLHMNTPLLSGVNKMNKTGGLVENIMWCWTSAAETHTIIQVHTLTHVQTSRAAKANDTHKGICAHARTKWSAERNIHNKYTHTACLTHPHAVAHSVEQACWVAVSTYSAAMATSSMAIDSAAKWVRVCECDNLV